MIDSVCFRRHGHNEADDPFVTQPMMYKRIAAHPGVRSRYAERLIAEGVVTESEARSMIDVYRAALDRGEHVELTALNGHRRCFRPISSASRAGIGAMRWKQLCLWLIYPVWQTSSLLNPAGFKLRHGVEKVLADRREMVRGKLPVDWGMAEHLAYATLLKEGYGVRLSGEDAGRGTFSHFTPCFMTRIVKNGIRAFVPLEHLSKNQAHFIRIDSILNEEAVLAFEYGYACSAPDELGDLGGAVWRFCQRCPSRDRPVYYLGRGQMGWRLCGLTMLLPHGYDGQGPSIHRRVWSAICSSAPNIIFKW